MRIDDAVTSPSTSTETPAANRLLLGRCTLDLTSGELRDAAGELAGLRKQALDVLLVLGRGAGEVISKDELMSQVWPTVVVGEGSLTQAIADIRRVLGDDGHRLVRNVSRRGYMLVPDKQLSAAVETLPASGADTPAPSAAPESPRALRRAWGPASISAIAVLALLIAVGAWLTLRSTAPSWRTPADMARVPCRARCRRCRSSCCRSRWTTSGGRMAGRRAARRPCDRRVAHCRTVSSSRATPPATYKGQAVDPRQVAREMGVRHVVQGSLRQEGTIIHLNLTLIDGESGVQRWAEAFDIDRAQLAQAVGDFAVAIERTLIADALPLDRRAQGRDVADRRSADDLAMQGYALWYRGVHARERARSPGVVRPCAGDESELGRGPGTACSSRPPS